MSFGEAEYFTRRIDFETFEVAKFESTDVPTAVYRIRHDQKGKLRCDCPRWLRKTTTSCKHTGMVEEYINNELANSSKKQASARHGSS